MKSLIFGTGKLAKHLLLKGHKTAIPRSVCDITAPTLVEASISVHSPDIVINCAANTNLESCEEDKSRAYDTNTRGVINLLHACASRNIKFVHISSGCLFDGNEVVSTEQSLPTPAAWYTFTKMWADQYIENYGYEDYLILRPRQMISAVAHPTNMLTKFANYGAIYAHEELNSITCVEDFVEMMAHLLEHDEKGIFNCCNDGVLTPYQIAMGVKEHIVPTLEVKSALYKETLLLQPNKRVNTILSNDKLKKTGFKPRTAEEALEWCLRHYNKE